MREKIRRPEHSLERMRSRLLAAKLGGCFDRS
jgi:hypothetical protein